MGPSGSTDVYDLRPLTHERAGLAETFLTRSVGGRGDDRWIPGNVVIRHLRAHMDGLDNAHIKTGEISMDASIVVYICLPSS